MRKRPIVEIEDVQEPFCGVRRKKLVPLADAEPEIAYEWNYRKNAGWGPEHLSRASGVRCWWICSFCEREYKAQINNRTSTVRSACPFCASKRICSDNSLVDLAPEVASEWHPTKNGRRKVTDIMRASSKKVWWLCKSCNHSWQCTPADRTVAESGCPACYEAKMQYAREHPKAYLQKPVILGGREEISRAWYEKPSSQEFVSLMETNVAVAKQWHPTKNGKWSAWDFAKGSDAIAWWKCKKGPDHEWQAPISSRTGRKSNCPFCSGRRVSITNNLKSRFPKIAKDWHPKLNGKVGPEDVTYGSAKKYWWRCQKSNDHVWKASASQRTGANRGCPYCTRHRVSDSNSLQSQFPYIAAQLHPTKNKGMTGKDLAAASSQKVWWICFKGPDHEWQATPANRTGRGSNCPSCAGKKPSVTNSLASLRPELAKQWDKKRNGKLRPSEVTAKSKKEAWWICAQGHSWLQAVDKRARTNGGCWECRTGKQHHSRAKGLPARTKSKKNNGETRRPARPDRITKAKT